MGCRQKELGAKTRYAIQAHSEHLDFWKNVQDGLDTGSSLDPDSHIPSFPYSYVLFMFQSGRGRQELGGRVPTAQTRCHSLRPVNTVHSKILYTLSDVNRGATPNVATTLTVV